MTATMTRPKTKATDKQLRKINGLSFDSPYELDGPEQIEADEINLLTDDVARREEELQVEREAILKKWFDTTPRSWQEASVPFQTRAEEVREDKWAILERRKELLPKCQRAYVRGKDKADAELVAVLDKLEAEFRAKGINEFSLAGGQYTNSNPDVVRERFRDLLLSEPEAMAATANVNKAISDMNVLASQFAIVPNTSNTSIKWRGVGGCQVPTYVSELFT